MPEQEAKQLIDYLLDFAHRPEFVYRHQWRQGDALLWDNRCTQHCAMPFDDAAYKRLMHRTTLEGEVPVMASKPVCRPQTASRRRMAENKNAPAAVTARPSTVS